MDVIGDDDIEPIIEARTSFDDIDVSERRRIEGSWKHRGPEVAVHAFISSTYFFIAAKDSGDSHSILLMNV